MFPKNIFFREWDRQGAAIRPIGAPGEIRSRTYDPMGSQWDRTVPSYRYDRTRNFNYKN